MSRYKVFVTRPLPPVAEPLIERLREMCEVEIWHSMEEPAPTAEKIRALDGLTTYGHEPITDAMMASAPNLKVISNIGVGHDHIDSEAARRRGIAVGNTPGVLSGATADMTFALLLAGARLLGPSSRYVRARRWRSYDPNLFWGSEVHHSTIGIVGMGRIGYEVAKRARGFDMTILYYKRNRREDWERELGMRYAPLNELLEASDFVTLHAPMSPETEGMIGAAELKRMKRTAVLVNAARGGVVNHAALYEALTTGEIAAAALDVTEPEPLPLESPLIDLDNCFIAPHLGSATVETRLKMITMALENLTAGLNGKPLPYSALERTL